MNKKYISITVFVLVFTLSLSFIAYGHETPIIPIPSGSTTQNEDTSGESTGDDWETPPSDVKVVVDINKCSFSAIANRVYSGKAQTPALTVKYGETALKKDTDYTLKYANNVKVGTATVTVTGKGDYTGTKRLTFKITKANNPITAKSKTATVKYSKLKKKNQTVERKNAITVSKAQGSVTYAKSSGNKKITVAKNGKITVKKGLKKGTYKVKIKVTASGNSTYKAKSNTVAVTIKIK